MKRLTKFIFDKAGYTAMADDIQKKIGVQTIDYSPLTFKNRKDWSSLTTFWIELASMPYFQTRVLKIRESVPDYQPNIVAYEAIFYGSAQKTIEFLEKLDNLFLKATGSVCPDMLFAQTFPPDIGPFEDLLKTIISEKLVIHSDLLHPLYLNIALSVSKKAKNITSPHSLTPTDMVFLGHFVCFLHKNPPYYQFLKKYLDDELALRFIFLAFAPSHRLHHLDWDTNLITESFERAISQMELYDERPDVATTLILTEEELAQKDTGGLE